VSRLLGGTLFKILYVFYLQEERLLISCLQASRSVLQPLARIHSIPLNYSKYSEKYAEMQDLQSLFGVGGLILMEINFLEVQIAQLFDF
jgi:hypothetical protein